MKVALQSLDDLLKQYDFSKVPEPRQIRLFKNSSIDSVNVNELCYIYIRMKVSNSKLKDFGADILKRLEKDKSL